MDLAPVREIHNVFVAGEKFLSLKGRRLGYKELERLPCIVLEGNTSTRTFTDAFLEESGRKLAPEFELATSRHGGAVCFQEYGGRVRGGGFREGKLRSGELFCLEFEEEMPGRQMCVATCPRNPVSPAGKRLLEMLGDERKTDTTGG